MPKYNHLKIEKKWQKYWLAKKTFFAKDFSKKPKKYVLVEFPYPSGEGLHMGHLRPYVAADVYTRYHRIKGNEVIFPMGWDAFGLPAENFAIKKGVHPSITTKKNVANAKRQMQSWGLSFDWSREVNTTDPNYYKWTQWIFLQFYKTGLAYEATGLINWCPKDKTGLANEEVIDGKCERCGSLVEKRELRQWYLKITAYAEKLLEGLKKLPEWPEPVKLQQENWIGKSEGCNIIFDIVSNSATARQYLKVFTTRVDTLPGATFIVAAPEHALIENFRNQIMNYSEVSRYVKEAKQKTDIQRTAKDKEKTGIELKGIKAANPLNGEQLPIWVADYALMGFGTGALFGDAHDERDQAFAKKYKIPLKVTLKPADGRDDSKIRNLEEVFIDDGILYNSGEFDGLTSSKAREAITKRLVDKGLGQATVSYKLRDWVFSRQRYWGEPIPLIHCDNCAKRRPKILLIHGLSGHSSENWFPWFKEQMEARGYEVLIPNLSNSEPPTLKGWLAELEKLGITTDDRVIVVGHSLGGRTACHFVLKNNFKAEKLILVGPTGESQGEQNWQNLRNAGVEERFVKSILEFNAEKINFEKLRKLVGESVIYLSDNDPYIPLSVADDYQALGPDIKVLKNKGHFNKRAGVTEFSEILGELPMVDAGIVPVPEKDLPVKLPNVKKYEPTGTGESPLAAIDKWVNVRCPVCKSSAKRETNTMPQWAGSSWYWLRYTDPKNKKAFASLKKQKYWTPVDVYFGGMEHTTLHLLYSRFWNLFLYDIGLATSVEPYTKRKPHGLILAEDGEKMSKSRGNVVNPDDIVKSHGADTLRMYELFLGPHEQSVSWNVHGHIGVRRFLDRVWNWANEVTSNKSQVTDDTDKILRALHKLIKKITEDIENFSFNTSISAFMEFHNQVKEEPISKSSLKTFLTLLYPFAPHIAEELNEVLAPRLRSGSSSGKKSLQLEAWPKYDPKLVIDDIVEIVVQINGKVKDRLKVAVGTDQKTMESLAKHLVAGQTVKRVVFVPNRLINFVT